MGAITLHPKRMVMRSFRGDCREAYVISYSYGMGDPLASRFREAGRTVEGGGITRPQLFEMTSPPQCQADRAVRFIRLWRTRNRRKDFNTIHPLFI